MLRALAGLLLALNLLFLAWAQGWLAPAWPPPRHGEREPERLAAQLRPELIRVLAPEAASAAVAAAREAALRCLEAGPFDAAGLAAAETALAGAGVADIGWERQEALPPRPRRWLLRVPRADIEQQPRLGAAGFRACEAP